MPSSFPIRRLCLQRWAWWGAAFAAGLIPLGLAQVKPERPDKEEMRELKREMQADPLAGKPKKQAKQEAKGKEGRATAEAEGESRTLTRLREYLEVTDDAEWAVIAERIQAVVESRTALGVGVPGFKGPAPIAEKGKRSPRTSGPGRAEQEALRSAVRDRLPDAELKVRLARAHEVFEQNQARMNKAHAELRAVLSVRQEAVAVLAGLLPP